MHLGPRARSFVFFTLAIATAGPNAHAGELAERPLPAIAGKIANGEPSQIFPSVGQLLTDQSTCSGTLVGCQTFLTAAHCLCQDPITGQILNGKQCNARPDLLDPAGKRVFLQHGGIFEVASIAVHPRFQFRIRSDLAVLTLTRPVTGIGTSRLNLVEKPALLSPATIVGFGLDGLGGLSGIKRVGSVVTSSCIGVANATHVCFTFDNPLGPPGSNSDTCQGDSGGPLFVNFGTSEVVAGVTSGGDGQGCHPIDHSFDADVFLDRAWLQSQGGVDLDHGFCGDLTPAGSTGSAILGHGGRLGPTSPQQGFTFTIPAGTERLRLALNAETGADLAFYALEGGRPIPQHADCQGETRSGPAFCEILAPTPGPWHVLVRRGAAEGNRETEFQLTGTLLSHLATAGPCIPSATVLCLNRGRFRAEVTWQTLDGTIGPGQAVPLTDIAGAFSFFASDSIELAVKLVNACGARHRRYWVVAAGLSNVRLLLRVTDTATGATRSYANPQGTPFGPVMDTAAFTTCP
jgi:hypothetical protein